MCANSSRLAILCQNFLQQNAKIFFPTLTPGIIMIHVTALSFSLLIRLCTQVAMRAILVAGMAVLVWPASAKQSKPVVSAPLAALGDAFFEARLRFKALSATEDVGDPRFDGALATDISAAHRAAEARQYERLHADLLRIAPQTLSKEERVTHELLRYELRASLDGLKHPSHLLPVHHMVMVPVKLAQSGSGNGVQPFKTAANYENYLKRIEALPAWPTQATDNLREGVKRGVVQHRAIVERSLTQLESIAKSDVSSSPFFQATKNFPEAFSPADKARLPEAYTQALRERALPALVTFHGVVKNEYLPRARSAAGGWRSTKRGRVVPSSGARDDDILAASRSDLRCRSERSGAHSL
jgi:uncharacterized protein (DUF885 family)